MEFAIGSRADIERSPADEVAARLAYVAETLRALKGELAGGKALWVSEDRLGRWPPTWSRGEVRKTSRG